jgi:hypothetical protein
MSGALARARHLGELRCFHSDLPAIHTMIVKGIFCDFSFSLCQAVHVKGMWGNLTEVDFEQRPSRRVSSSCACISIADFARTSSASSSAVRRLTSRSSRRTNRSSRSLQTSSSGYASMRVRGLACRIHSIQSSQSTVASLSSANLGLWAGDTPR